MSNIEPNRMNNTFYEKNMNQTKINHALVELLTHEELLAYHKGCHFAATLGKMLAEPALAAEPVTDPHAELRKTWREGQRWQAMSTGDWVDIDNYCPMWAAHLKYRRHPDDLQEPDADGWIAHDGKECPVAADALVSVRMRHGKVSRYFKAGHFVWPCFDELHNGDITHYRLG